MAAIPITAPSARATGSLDQGYLGSDLVFPHIWWQRWDFFTWQSAGKDSALGGIPYFEPSVATNFCVNFHMCISLFLCISILFVCFCCCFV